MSVIKGGELLLRCLQKEGVECIFGLPEFDYQSLLECLRDCGIRLITPRHEAAAVHMGEGYFKTSGKVPVVMAGTGPGTANMISGLIVAHQEGIPVISISSQRRQEVLGPLKPGTFQGMDQYDLLKPVTKWNASVYSWERIPDAIQQAYRQALNGRPGPVHLEITETVFNDEKDENLVKLLEPNQYRSVLLEPSSRQIEEIVSLIAGSRQTLVFAGTGVLNAEAWGELTELVELLNCPVTTSIAARSAVSNDHPNYLFCLGKGALMARKEADLILAVGTRFGEMNLPFDKYFGEQDRQKVIQIDIDPVNIGVNRPVSLGIVADAKQTLKLVLERLKQVGAKAQDSELISKYKDLEAEGMSEFNEGVLNYEGEQIHPARSIEIVNKVFPKRAVQVIDGGNTSLYAAGFTKLNEPRSSIGLYEFGHLGCGIPAALGAKLANPEKDVYVVTGDGAAGFNFMEMASALLHQLKITVIVHAEESWTMEETCQLMDFGSPESVIGCEQPPIRWDRLAEGIGCHGEYVDKVEDLEAAVIRAKESDLPALVCVKTDKQENLLPPFLNEFSEVYMGPMEG